MKKIVAFILICIMVFATVGCVKDSVVADDTTADEETSVVETTAEDEETNDHSVDIEPATENNEPEQEPAESEQEPAEVETTNANTEKPAEDITTNNPKKEPISTTAVTTFAPKEIVVTTNDSKNESVDTTANNTNCDPYEETPKDTTTETIALVETTNILENNEPFIREHKYVFTTDNATRTYTVESISNDKSPCDELVSHTNYPDQYKGSFECTVFIPAGAWFTRGGSACCGHEFRNEDGTWSNEEYRDITKDQWLCVFGEYKEKYIWDDFNKTWRYEQIGTDCLEISVFYEVEK